jgi:hypothetical protein
MARKMAERVAVIDVGFILNIRRAASDRTRNRDCAPSGLSAASRFIASRNAFMPIDCYGRGIGGRPGAA